MDNIQFFLDEGGDIIDFHLSDLRKLISKITFCYQVFKK